MKDRIQLQRVMNLMLNAAEAMAVNGGEFSTRSHLREEGQVVIPVSDTGVALPTGNVEQMLDTFFSTNSHGTGLGSAIACSIVASNGGRILSASNSGAGAPFHFTPRSREAATT